MTNAWVVRAGRDGEHEKLNLDEGVATIGWSTGDLTEAKSRDDVRAIMDSTYPDSSLGRRANHTGQVWAFRNSINEGDIIVMPSKLRPGYIFMGRCVGDYRYCSEQVDPKRRHQLPVVWKDDPVAKSSIKDDLLYSLNAILTVFNPTRNNAGQRIISLYEAGTDPGNNSPSTTAPNQPHYKVPTLPNSDDSAGVKDVTDPDTVPTLEAIKDRIRTHLVENFAGHKMTWLVADILEALGYHCEVSPEGPDGGVDILAGRGPLGLDSPTLIVEVKSEHGPQDVKVVRGIHSAMTQHKADQGLLVAWGGVTKAASREFQRDRTTFRVWDAEELLARLFETYDRLPPSTRTRIPLKQAWVLDDEDQ